MVKHSRFSTFDSIKNYASLTNQLTDPILNGKGSNLSLGEFLGNKLKIGEYHKVDDLKIELFFFLEWMYIQLSLHKGGIVHCMRLEFSIQNM